jgi:hypothetical protein
MNMLGMTAYDTLFPGAVVRVTFQKAHFWHPADVFLSESRKVYDRISSVANVYILGSGANRTAFPLGPDGTTWTVDVRTQRERSASDLARALADACNIVGTVDVVELATMEILSQEKVKGANTATGARERANASDAATATAADNPISAATSAAKNAIGALGSLGKWVVIAVVAIAIVLVLTRKK